MWLTSDNQSCLKLKVLISLLQNLTDPNSDEHQHLIEALIGMEKVAEHINEMQRIHEEYGAIFDHLFRQHQKSSKQVKLVKYINKVQDLIFDLFSSSELKIFIILEAHKNIV